MFGTIVPLPRENYDKLFEIQAVFQPKDGPLVEVHAHEVAEIASSLEEGRGRLYGISDEGLFARLHEVDDLELLREIYQVPNAEGWRVALASLEEEQKSSTKEPDDRALRIRRDQLVYRQWRREHNFEVDEEPEENYFDRQFTPSDWSEWDDLPDLEDDKAVDS